MDSHETSPASAAEQTSFRMVDVGEKPVTFRRALAAGRIVVGEEAFRRIAERRVPKGDVLALAEVAGIQAAKRTADWLPLCHPLLIDRAKVTLSLGADRKSIEARAEICGHGKTGFEMEALTATSAALLCVYDLVKAIEPRLEISGVTLLEKEGGKSGHWVAGESAPRAPEKKKTNLAGVKSAVLTVSDRASRGLATDTSGPALVGALREAGASVEETACVPDEAEAIARLLRDWSGSGVRLAFVTGGTGLSPRDVTPEAIRAVCDREIPGIGERLRADGALHTPMAYLSRSLGAQVGEMIVVALPGSEKAVREGWAALAGLLPHALHTARGGGHEK